MYGGAATDLDGEMVEEDDDEFASIRAHNGD